MKTSNKLLIAILVFLPSTLILYNFLLKGEYVKGNIRSNGPSGIVKSNKHPLKPFRHVVYDGALWKNESKVKRRTYSEHHKLTLFIGTDTASYVDSSPMLDRCLQIRQQGDTLFLSHEITGQTEGEYNVDKSLRIYTPELVSVNGERCGMEIFNFPKKNTPLKVHMGAYANCTMQGLPTALLDLQLEDFSVCNLNFGGRIDTLTYQMKQHASLNVWDKVQINALQTGSVDTSANISLFGKAAGMSRFLQTTQ